MTEPKWLTVQMIVAIHDEQLAIYGGSPGLRDAGLLESALDRARNKWAYESRPSYPNWLPRTVTGLRETIHSWTEINGPLLAIYTFLGLNGIDFVVPEPAAAAMILSLAAGEISEDGLARWIRDNLPKS